MSDIVAAAETQLTALKTQIANCDRHKADLEVQIYNQARTVKDAKRQSWNAHKRSELVNKLERLRNPAAKTEIETRTMAEITKLETTIKQLQTQLHQKLADLGNIKPKADAERAETIAALTAELNRMDANPDECLHRTFAFRYNPHSRDEGDGHYVCDGCAATKVGNDYFPEANPFNTRT